MELSRKLGIVISMDFDRWNCRCCLNDCQFDARLPQNPEIGPRYPAVRYYVMNRGRWCDQGEAAAPELTRIAYYNRLRAISIMTGLPWIQGGLAS